MKLLKNILLFGFFIFLFYPLKSLVVGYEFPITELGNCRNWRECHLYCEVPANKAACWSFSVYSPQGRVLGDESTEESIAQLGIVFPITQLGNCANVSACKAYCSITQNVESCQNFAQTHDVRVKETILTKAKEELGCNSRDDCHNFCEQESNREVCHAFAQRYHLRGEIKNKLIENAKQELGCNSHEECKNLCELPQNRTACVAFANKLNIVNNHREELVAEAKEKLGCTSFEDCKTFCQDKTNRDKCHNFGQAVSESARIRNLIKEGGCNTVTQCRLYCEENPEKCPDFPKLNATDSSIRRLKTKESDSLEKLPDKRIPELRKSKLLEQEKEINNEIETEIEQDDLDSHSTSSKSGSSEKTNISF